MTRREFLQRSALAVRLQRAAPASKVVVAGAGLAGLAAAYELAQAGHDVTVLEARLRPGGRVYTLREPFADGLYAETGARFIYEKHDLTSKYANMFELRLRPVAIKGATVNCLRGIRIAVKPGEPVDLPVELKPEERKLGRFAGDQTSSLPGWMQGALESGIRAAREVREAAA